MTIERIIILFLGIVVIGYLIFMSKLRKKSMEYEDFPYDPRFASYTPNVKHGDYSVRLDKGILDLESINKIIVRYNREPLQSVAIGDVILTGVDSYTAEDFVEDLDYIKIAGEIIKEEIAIN